MLIREVRETELPELLEILKGMDGEVGPDPGESLSIWQKINEYPYYKIFVAEDNEINQQVATELLESQGIQVTVANDGRAAVDAVLQVKFPPGFDLVLMDLQMPNMDGFDATAAIRKHGKKLPIIAMTAHAMEEERARCLAAGMNDHVAKPIDPHTLFVMLARWAPQQRGGTPLSDFAPAPVDGNDSEVVIANETILDTHIGLKRVAGNKSLYYKLLRQYLAGQSDAVTRMREALTNGDMNLGARIVHSFKGVSGNIGATAIAALAAEIEQAIQTQRQQAESLALLDRLADEFVNLSLVIQGYLPGESIIASPDRPKPPSALLVAELQQLNALLAEMTARRWIVLTVCVTRLQLLAAGRVSAVGTSAVQF